MSCVLTPTKVLIVEDHPLVRLGLSHALASHPSLQKCGEADNEVDAWNLIESTEPDVAIIDLTLNSGTGLDLIKKLALRRPEVRIVVSSMHDRCVYEERCLRAGAAAYVAKDSGIDVMLAVLDDIAESLASDAHPDASSTENFTCSSLAAEANPVTACLTDRELEVFRQIGKGLSTRQIAESLHRSVKTIESYRAKLKKKLGLHSSEALVRDAVRWVFEHDAA